MRISNKAFTIVELLVVITIIGLLMALLLPGLNSMKGRAREAQCMNRQRSIGQAMIAYASKKEYFPGRVSQLESGSGTIAVSWFVRLLPFLGRTDIHDAISVGVDGLPGTFPSDTYLEIAVCPSDRTATSAGPQLSYAANTGVWDPSDGAWRDLPANGICHNLLATNQAQKRLTHKSRVSIGYVANHDGTSTTILASENVDARLWFSPGRSVEGDTGIVWTGDPALQKAINRESGLAPTPMNEQFSRPSSGHIGIVVTLFCDGHTEALSEEVDRNVYARMMTPYGKGCALGPNSGVPKFQLEPLSDADIP